ncbi:MAG: hypothetical protein VX438_13330 [Planctomycetota bacterium]|nr:hypothetical protein [Planctomycetota bacterium]
MRPDLKAYLLCPNAETNPLYSSWMAEIEHKVVNDYDHSWEPPKDCGVLVSHLHYDFPTASILERTVKHNTVPVLVLADGILEFRNTYQNPKVPAGSLFMPVHGHKIACLGFSQARHIEAWGNTHKCEVVGLPRLDSLIPQRVKPSQGEIRVLVVTARQPGFTDQQVFKVQKSLSDLKSWFDQNPTFQGTRVKPIWRLTGGLDQKIGVNQQPAELEGNQIHQVMQQVNAVVATPSTTLLESMALGLPTAVLDYTNSPKFVATAWNISAKDHVDPMLRQLLQPTDAHLLFQQAAWTDAYQSHEPATARMKQLLAALIQCRATAIRENSILKIPDRILDPGLSHAAGKSSQTQCSLQDVFPQKISFQAKELETLTTQYDQIFQAVGQLHHRIEDQKELSALARQQARMAWRHHDYVADQVKWLRAEIQRLQHALRIARRPTRLQRRLRVRGSIAFQRFQFFVEQVQDCQSPSQNQFSLEPLFELTGYPKANKIPPTIRNYQPNRKQNPQIKIWKTRPSQSLIRKINKQTQITQKRIRLLRVVRTN